MAGSLTALIAAPDVAFAHPGKAVAPHDLLTAWTFAPGVLLAMAVACALYFRGQRAFRQHAARDSHRAARQQSCFVAAMVVVAAALISPMDSVSDALFSAHMVQHLLLIVVAAPLLVSSEPLLFTLWALPLVRRRAITQWWRARTALQRVWTTLTLPLAAWIIHIALIWMWHIPRFYNAAVLTRPLHILEHSTFLGSALLFWWVALHRRLRIGGAVLYMFTAALQCTLLGALLAIANTPWFFVHFGSTQAWGLTPIQDQQLAGLIMWVPGGMAYLIALVPRFVTTLRERSGYTPALFPLVQ